MLVGIVCAHEIIPSMVDSIHMSLLVDFVFSVDFQLCELQSDRHMEVS